MPAENPDDFKGDKDDPGSADPVTKALPPIPGAPPAITDDFAGGDATYIWRPGFGHEPFPRYLPARMRVGLESGAWHFDPGTLFRLGNFDPGTLFRLGNFDPVPAAKETSLTSTGRMLAESPMTIGAPIGSIAEPAPPPAIPPCVCGGRDSERIMLGVDMATGGATSRAEARPFLVCRDCGTIRDMKVAIESAARRPTYRRYEPPGAIRLPTEVTPLDPAVAERMDRARAAMLAQHARDFAERRPGERGREGCLLTPDRAGPAALRHARRR
jgi:hypothetical protein